MKNETTHQMMFLNAHGDSTLEWDDSDNSKMVKRIKKLIDEGHQFFIVSNRFGIPFGLAGTKLKKIKGASDIKNNKMVIKDEMVKEMFDNIETIKMVDNDDASEYDVKKQSKDAEEIAKSNSVCTKPSTRG